MMFNLAKDRMEKSKLWNIVRKMPKGTLLHCHLEAMLDLDWVLAEAFVTDGICIRSDAPLSSAQARLKTGFSFTYSKANAKSDVSIWSDEYAADTQVPLVTAADNFPDGGRKGFIEWIRMRTSITPEEHLNHHEGPNEVWRKFMSCFPILGSIIYYEPVFRKFIRKMCHQLLEDGTFYVDLRSAFYTPYRSLGQEDWDPDYSGMLQHLEEAVADFKNSEEGKGFWGVRMIWTTVRAFDNRTIVNSKPLLTTASAIPFLTLNQA